MDIIFGCMIGLGTMALVEGFIKPLVSSYTKRKLLRYLPLVLQQVDKFLPSFMADSPTEDELRAKMSKIIYGVGEDLGESPSETEVQQILAAADSAYSFITNVRKLATSSGEG